MGDKPAGELPSPQKLYPKEKIEIEALEQAALVDTSSYVSQPDPRLFISLVGILDTHLTKDENPGKFFVIKNGVKIIL